MAATPIDAAVAAAAVLAVVEPTMTGIGGDLVRDCLRREDQDAARLERERPIGVRRRRPKVSPSARSAGHARHRRALRDGARCRRWLDTLLSAHGTMPLSKSARPGDRLRDERLRGVGNHQRRSGKLPKASCPPILPRHERFSRRPCAPARRDLRESESRGYPATDCRLAAATRSTKADRRRAIVADHEETSTACSTTRDFAEHKSDWVEPISTSYRGYDVYEMPPNTQGFLRARDAEHPRGLRHQVARPQFSGATCTCSSKPSESPLPTGPPTLADPDSVPPAASEDADLEGVRGGHVARRSIRRKRYKPTHQLFSGARGPFVDGTGISKTSRG